MGLGRLYVLGDPAVLSVLRDSPSSPAGRSFLHPAGRSFVSFLVICGSRLSHGHPLRRVETRTDPPSRTVRFTCAPAGRLVTDTLHDLRACPKPVERVIQTTYDADGNVASIPPPSRPPPTVVFGANLDQKFLHHQGAKIPGNDARNTGRYQSRWRPQACCLGTASWAHRMLCPHGALVSWWFNLFRSGWIVRFGKQIPAWP